MLTVQPRSDPDPTIGHTTPTNVLNVQPRSDPNPTIGHTAPTTVAIIVLAKLPMAGRVKTRLCPPCTLSEAAEIAEAAFQDTLETVICARSSRPDVVREVVVCLERHGFAPPDWMSGADRIIDQCPGDLADRLAHVFASVAGPAVLIGMDTPQVTVDLLVEAAIALNHGRDASLIGPATDGGFWIIGFGECPPNVFRDVPMSSDHTGDEQLRSMLAAGLTPRLFPVLSDFDTFDDAIEIASSHRHSRTWAIVNRIIEDMRTTDRIPGPSRDPQAA
jgi:uncharacterized protein